MMPSSVFSSFGTVALPSVNPMIGWVVVVQTEGDTCLGGVEPEHIGVDGPRPRPRLWPEQHDGRVGARDSVDGDLVPVGVHALVDGLDLGQRQALRRARVRRPPSGRCTGRRCRPAAPRRPARRRSSRGSTRLGSPVSPSLFVSVSECGAGGEDDREKSMQPCAFAAAVSSPARAVLPWPEPLGGWSLYRGAVRDASRAGLGVGRSPGSRDPTS